MREPDSTSGDDLDSTGAAPQSPPELPDLDLSRPNPARMYAAWLGDKDNFEIDREAAAEVIKHVPDAPLMARANRMFLQRAVIRLVTELKVTQLLDIGSGLPTANNVHEVAHKFDDSARIVYVDNDVLVAAHSRALLATDPAGRVAFVLADAARPRTILTDLLLSDTLDLTRPVALMLVSVLMYFDDATAVDIVTTLMDALPIGSCLTISHPTADFAPEAVARAVAAAAKAGVTYVPRSRDQMEALFAGFELLEPGIVPMLAWRPDHDHDLADHYLADYTGVADDPTRVYYWVGMAVKT